MMGAFLDWDREPLAIVADKAYGSTRIRQQIADEGALAVIPSKSNVRKPIPHDPDLYAKRNIVERFFCKMKDMRRLATRFEKTATSFRSMPYIFAFRCWHNLSPPLTLIVDHALVSVHAPKDYTAKLGEKAGKNSSKDRLLVIDAAIGMTTYDVIAILFYAEQHHRKNHRERNNASS